METRMRGFGAEVDRAVCPSTVTNSSPPRKPADKHSIYTRCPPTAKAVKRGNRRYRKMQSNVSHVPPQAPSRVPALCCPNARRLARI